MPTSPNPAPYELIGVPGALYLALPGSTFPDVDTEPTTPWTLVGKSGDRNYADDGITVEAPQSVNLWRALGSVGPIKGFRQSEDFLITAILADLTLENYSNVVEYHTVTSTAAGVGTPGTKKIGLSRGFSLKERMLLFRIEASAYGDLMQAQYEVPRVIQVGEPKPVFRKDGPAMLEFKFQALEDPNAANDDERFGRLVMQTEDAET